MDSFEHFEFSLLCTVPPFSFWGPARPDFNFFEIFFFSRHFYAYSQGAVSVLFEKVENGEFLDQSTGPIPLFWRQMSNLEIRPQNCIRMTNLSLYRTILMLFRQYWSFSTCWLIIWLLPGFTWPFRWIMLAWKIISHTSIFSQSQSIFTVLAPCYKSKAIFSYKCTRKTEGRSIMKGHKFAI